MIQLLLLQPNRPTDMTPPNAGVTAERSPSTARPSDTSVGAGLMTQLALAALLASPLVASAADHVAAGSFQAGVQGAGLGFFHPVRADGFAGPFDVERGHDRHEKVDEIFGRTRGSDKGNRRSESRWPQSVLAEPGEPALGLLPTLAVPEPGTYALMLAGLATVVLLVRRRRPE